MLPIFFIIFAVVPVVELIVLIKVGSNIGAVNTVILTLLIGVTGALLARIQGFLVLQNIQNNLAQGIMPTEEMLDGLMIFGGGVLLLTPGFITDGIGLIMLFPMTRWIAKLAVKEAIKAMLKSGQVTTFSNRSRSQDDDIIDV